MAIGDNFGGYAVSLPSLFGTPGEALQTATAQAERRGEKALEIAKQQRLLEQKQREENLGSLLKATQFEKYDTPDIELNKITQKELGKIFSEGRALLSKDPVEFQNWIATRPKELNDWYRMAKTDLGNVTAQRQEFNKDFPNVNLAKANNMVSKNFLDNYTELDPNTGERLIKPTHLITPQNDYYSQLKTPQALGEITEYTQPATDLFTKIKTENVGDKQYTNKRGQSTTKKWSGVITPFTQMDEDEKGNPIAVTKYETMGVVNPKTGKMEDMKLATPEMLQYVTQSSPGATAAIYKLWADEKKAKGLTNLDPAVEEPLFKNFVYKYADRNLPHQIKTEEGTVIPKVTVNVGGLAEKKADIIGNYLNTFEGAVRSGDADQIENLANKFYGLKGGKANYSGVKIFKRPNGSVTGFQINYIDDKGKNKGTDVISVTDENLRDKLQGIYQKISGSETLAEIANLKDLSSKNKDKNATFTFKGKTYTAAQIEKAAKASNMTVEEYKNALNK